MGFPLIIDNLFGGTPWQWKPPSDAGTHCPARKSGRVLVWTLGPNNQPKAARPSASAPAFNFELMRLGCGCWWMVPHGTRKSGLPADNYRGMNGYETMLKIWVSMGFPDVVNPLWGTLCWGTNTFTDFPAHVWSADWLRIPSNDPSMRMHLLYHISAADVFKAVQTDLFETSYGSACFHIFTNSPWTLVLRSSARLHWQLGHGLLGSYVTPAITSSLNSHSMFWHVI